MARYLIRRIIQAIPTFFGITVLAYGMMLGAPGGPVAALFFGQSASPEDIERMEAALGVNDPFPIQYLRWLAGDDWMRWDSDGDGISDGAFILPLDANGDGEPEPPGTQMGVLRGDFGRSFAHRRPAIDVITERLGATLELGVSALSVGLILGVLIGVLAAVNHNRWFDNVTRVLAVIINALPNFWLGLLLLLFFGSFLGVLPLGDRCDPIDSMLTGCPPLWARMEYLILPTIVLAGGSIAGFSRFMRASMLDVVSRDYIRTANAKGLKPRTIWWRHGTRNALLPIATFLGPSITFLLGGAAVVETVFTWPGVGRLAVQAVGQRDYPVVMIVTVYTAAATIIGYLLSDVLYAVLDPRIRYD